MCAVSVKEVLASIARSRLYTLIDATANSQLREAHKLENLLARATGDDCGRKALGHTLDRTPHLLRHECELGTRDNRRQCAVIVKEDDEPPALEGG